MAIKERKSSSIMTSKEFLLRLIDPRTVFMRNPCKRCLVSAACLMDKDSLCQEAINYRKFYDSENQIWMRCMVAIIHLDLTLIVFALIKILYN